MSKYKNLMLSKGIMQKELLDNVRRVDNRVDKSLLSKFVNDVCLPTPKVLDCICKSVKCGVLDVYDIHEIDFLHNGGGLEHEPLLKRLVKENAENQRTIDGLNAKISLLETLNSQKYDKHAEISAANAVATTRKDRGGLSHGSNVYNLTVEIRRDVAERVLNKKALRKLGYLSKTDCVQQFIYALDKKYQRLLEKEKAAKGGQTHLDG